jgi:nucleoside-diphosphate-sugar epimerase
MGPLSPALVTGASGFVGSHLAEALAKRGVRTRLLVRSTSRLPFELGEGMELAKGDVTDEASVREAAKGVAVIYHLAGILRGSNPGVLEAVNAEGTRNVCKASEAAGTVKRLVDVSSLSAAGPSRGPNPITEEDPCRPACLYGATKLKGEEIALTYRSKFPLTILRPGAVYGPRETDIFSYFKMVRQGLVVTPSIDQKVGFIQVSDLVEAILLAAGSPKAEGETYFVTDGKGYGWDELCAAIGKALGRKYFTIKVPMPVVKMVAALGDLAERMGAKPSMVNLDKVREAYFPSWVCSTAKITGELGFRPRYDLVRGVEDAAKFYLEKGWLKR